MFGVGVVALRGDKRGATQMAFGLPEWVIGLLGSTSLFQPKMRQATSIWGWVGERRIGFKTPYPLPRSAHIRQASLAPSMVLQRFPSSCMDCGLREPSAALQVRAISASFSISAIMDVASFGAGHLSATTCMWPEFRVRRELNLPPLPPRSSANSPAHRCQPAAFIPSF